MIVENKADYVGKNEYEICVNYLKIMTSVRRIFILKLLINNNLDY